MSHQVINHPWQLSYKKAVDLQRQLRKRVIVADQDNWPPETVAGADISYDRRHNMLFAAVLIFSYPDLTLMVVEQQLDVASFPYIPGLLTFREGPLPSNTALVFELPASEPALASVKPKAASISPEHKGGSHFFFCSSEPK